MSFAALGVLAAALAADGGALAAESAPPSTVEAGAADSRATVLAPIVAPAERPDAGTVSSGFDVVATPWGPGRRSSGEHFRSTAEALAGGPLLWSWGDYSLAVGAQYFARGEVRDNSDFRSDVGDTSVGADHRARLSVRGSAKERVGVLLEFQDVRGWGSEPSTVGVTPNTGLHQGFIDVRATGFLDVRIGRQELGYGEDRLIGLLDWAQAARSFDGVFVRLRPTQRFTLDGFGMLLKPPSRETLPTGERRYVPGQYFAGLYSRTRLGRFGFDVYALGANFARATVFPGGPLDEVRLTFGARAFANLGGFSVVGEGALQPGWAGPVSAGLPLAGAVALKATYTLKSLWGAPYVLGEFSAASPEFHQLFPTGHVHLGFMDYVGWQNVLAARGSVGVRPWGAHLWLDVHHFRAWDPSAPWYAASGAVFLPADAARADGNMGTELDFNLTVPVLPQVAVSGNVSVFLPGGEARQGRGGSASTWGFLYVRAQL